MQEEDCGQEALTTDPPICLTRRDRAGFENERGTRAGGSIQVSHRPLPQTCPPGSSPDRVASCSSKKGIDQGDDRVAGLRVASHSSARTVVYGHALGRWRASFLAP